MSRILDKKHMTLHGLKGLFLSALLIALTVWVGFMARNEAREYKYIGVPADVRNTITVSGTGEVTAIPDIATVSIGSVVERVEVADAQEENSRIMNGVHDMLEDEGVEKEDIKTTSYNIYPRYDYDRKTRKQTLRGYEVSQNVSVKIRDLDDIGDILGAAGQSGVNQVGSINFTIDDPEALQDEAREKAFIDAKEKAETLGKVMGVKLRRVVSFSESGSQIPYPRYAYAEKAMGIGGDMAVAPEIEPGSTDITISVSVTYEIE